MTTARFDGTVLAACLTVVAVVGCASSDPSEDATGGPAAGGSGSSPGRGGDGATGTGGDGATGTGGDGGSGPPEGKVPVFIAQGSVGRTVLSCDDGHTWTGDHAWDTDADPILCGQAQEAVCYESTCSYQVGGECIQMSCCDHSPDVAKGVAYGDGKFVATWGWGQPGAMRTSDDGIAWETTHPDDSFGGIAYGGGRFVAASRFPFWSEDGVTWTAGDTADFKNLDGSDMWSVRRFAYADYEGGGRFVAVASGDTDRDMLVSSDGGQSWWRPRVIPDDCAHDVSTYGGIVAGNGVIVIVGQDANACRSTDGGETWSVAPTGLGEILSHGVWTGTEFVFWGDDAVMIHSADGASWTHTPMTTPMRLGPVARSDTGTYVGLGSVWTGYAQQSFYRSTDGLTWEELPSSSFQTGHPIFYITFGYAEPTEACPLP